MRSLEALPAPSGPYSILDRLDRVVARMLFIAPSSVLSTPPRARRDPLFGVALLVAAVRCVLRYAILPFGLPLLGFAPGVAGGIGLAFDVVALAVAVTGLRRLWIARHPQRWRYLLAVSAAILVVGVMRTADSAQAATLLAYVA